ncbi:hypothetical protein J3454_14325 [Erythrobacter sp. NFXS35]|uniref:hypothetical protein n=1 Tax=Erythrobacter sp. NFXS35 TaxID=2818436 RepID=UPI0032DFC320
MIELSDQQKQIARQAAVDALMPRLLALSDWQTSKRDGLKGRIARIRAWRADDLPEVQAAMNAIRAVEQARRSGEDCGDDCVIRGGLASLPAGLQSGEAINRCVMIDAGDGVEATSSLPPRILPAPSD